MNILGIIILFVIPPTMWLLLRFLAAKLSKALEYNYAGSYFLQFLATIASLILSVGLIFILLDLVGGIL